MPQINLYRVIGNHGIKLLCLVWWNSGNHWTIKVYVYFTTTHIFSEKNRFCRFQNNPSSSQERLNLILEQQNFNIKQLNSVCIDSISHSLVTFRSVGFSVRYNKFPVERILIWNWSGIWKPNAYLSAKLLLWIKSIPLDLYCNKSKHSFSGWFS